MDILKDLAGSTPFWSAIVILLLALRMYLLPDMPQYLVDALHGVAIIVFGLIAARYVQKKAQVRAMIAESNAPK